MRREWLLRSLEQELIRRFLTEFKRIVTSERGLDLIDRPKNLRTLSRLGLTEHNLKDELLALSVTDYCSGPDEDRDKRGEIWVFGRTIGEAEIYIKLKIADVEGESVAKCMSFHEAEFPLCYKFKSDE